MRRTLTYEAPGVSAAPPAPAPARDLDPTLETNDLGSFQGDCSPPTGLLLSSQTFTAETSNTTTTTHITKVPVPPGDGLTPLLDPLLEISGSDSFIHDGG